MELCYGVCVCVKPEVGGVKVCFSTGSEKNNFKVVVVVLPEVGEKEHHTGAHGRQFV